MRKMIGYWIGRLLDRVADFLDTDAINNKFWDDEEDEVD